MEIETAVQWMVSRLSKEGCLYQDDVVDYLVKSESDQYLRENSDGNLVLHRKLLNEFKNVTKENVVWVKPDKYWRYRVAEDEPGRDASG